MSTCNCNGACRVAGVRCPADDLQLDVLIVSPPPTPFTLAPQPPPVNVDRLPASWSLVIRDMHDRDEQGRAKYGVPLRPHNGRDQLVDSYQEVLDLERDGR